MSLLDAVQIANCVFQAASVTALVVLVRQFVTAKNFVVNMPKPQPTARVVEVREAVQVPYVHQNDTFRVMERSGDRWLESPIGDVREGSKMHAHVLRTPGMAIRHANGTLELGDQ